MSHSIVTSLSLNVNELFKSKNSMKVHNHGLKYWKRIVSMYLSNLTYQQIVDGYVPQNVGLG